MFAEHLCIQRRRARDSPFHNNDRANSMPAVMAITMMPLMLHLHYNDVGKCHQRLDGYGA